MSEEPIAEPVATDESPAESSPALPTEEVAPPLEESAPPKEMKPAEKRIHQLVAKTKEQERELEELRQRVNAAAPIPPPPGDLPAAPKLEQFETYAEFEAAKDEYLVKRAEMAVAQRLRSHAIQQAQTSLEQSFEARLAEAAAEDPELLAIRNDQTLPISQPVAALIKQSTVAPDVLRYLNQHRDVAAKLSTMHPMQAAVMFGRLEAQMQSVPPPPKPKTVSAAPEPIKPLSPTGSNQPVDEADLPIEEFMRRRNKAQFGR